MTLQLMKVRSMKLRSLIVFGATAMMSVALHAQVGLYVNPIAIRVSNTVADTGTYAFLGQGVTARTFWGVNFGGYYDYSKGGYKITPGIDFRDSILHANNANLNNFLVGLRLSYKVTDRLKPYVEPYVGSGKSEAPLTGIPVSKVEYGVYGGVDYQLNRHFDWRVIEIGYGSLSTASSGTISGTMVVPASTLLSGSTGFVVRF